MSDKYLGEVIEIKYSNELINKNYYQNLLNNDKWVEEYSGFMKKKINENKVKVNKLGINGDKHGHEHHGGEDRAILLVTTKYYEDLKLRFNDIDSLVAGSCGENIIINSNQSHYTLCVGDLISIGSTVLKISMPRYPCVKVNMFHHEKFLKQYCKNAMGGGPGFFCRVIKEGYISTHDDVKLIERPYPNWTLYRLQYQTHVQPCMDREVLEEMIFISGLGLRHYRNELLDRLKILPKETKFKSKYIIIIIFILLLLLLIYYFNLI